MRVAVHFSSRISESSGFGVSHICLTSKARPEEERSVVAVWELTDLCVCERADCEIVKLCHFTNTLLIYRNREHWTLGCRVLVIPQIHTNTSVCFLSAQNMMALINTAEIIIWFLNREAVKTKRSLMFNLWRLPRHRALLSHKHTCCWAVGLPSMTFVSTTGL